jgi:hypothetical protein
MSKQAYFSHCDGHWHFHLMLFVPLSEPVAWGAGLLIHELAEYERKTGAVLITEEDWTRDGFGSEPKFRAIYCGPGWTTGGYARFSPFCSTWTGSGIFFEDLFVRELFRARRCWEDASCQVARSHDRKVVTAYAWMSWIGMNRQFGSTSRSVASISGSGEMS